MTIPLLTSIALLQTALFARLSLWGARVDLMLLAVLVWTVVRGVDEGLVWGFVGGLIIDLLSGGPLGVTVLSLLAVAFLAGQPWARGIGSPTIQLLLSTFIAVLIYHLVMLTVLAWTGYPVDWAGAILRVAGPSALFNASLAPFVQRPLVWLERRTRRERFTL